MDLASNHRDFIAQRRKIFSGWQVGENIEKITVVFLHK
jgi:hypothetical protein